MGELCKRFCRKNKKEWCIFTADIYAGFTTKSTLNCCSACRVGPKSMLCLRIAAFEEIFLFWTWADVGCWEAPTQRCHNSWAPAQKEQGLSLKTQTNHQNEEKKGLSPLAGLPCVVIPCDCMREGEIPPSHDNQGPRHQGKTGVDECCMREATLKRETALSFVWYLLWSGNEDFLYLWTLQYVYKSHQKTPASVLWTGATWRAWDFCLAGWIPNAVRVLVSDLLGFILRCR